MVTISFHSSGFHYCSHTDGQELCSNVEGTVKHGVIFYFSHVRNSNNKELCE